MEPLTSKPSSSLEVPESMIYFVYLVMLIDVMASCISTPVMPFYAKSFGVSEAYIGYLYAAWSLTATVFAAMLSAMADTWGRKRVLTVCLVGAGCANVIQGLAIYVGRWGFAVFLFGRAFSGVWASVGATCNVYVSDVTAEGPLRQKYLGQLSMVPTLAIMTGPGIGGGLAKAFGNNFPVMIDGIITLFTACLVQAHMVETPAFLRLQKEKLFQVSLEATSGKKKDAIPTPTAVHMLGPVNLISTLASQGNLAMYALFFKAIYGFGPLYVGFLFMGSAVMMCLTVLVVVPVFSKRLGMPPIRQSALGGFIGSVGLMSLGFTGLASNIWVSTATMLAGSVGGGISMAQAGAVTSSFTNVENRGKIFGIIQTYQNVGKIFGPMLSTNVGSYGIPGVTLFQGPSTKGLPFVMNGAMNFIAMFGLLFIRPPGTGQTKQKLERKETQYGAEWEDEAGSEEDVLAMGKYVTTLLKERHYRWVSRRAEIEALLDHVLPELTTKDRESYQQSFNEADKMGFDTSTVGV